jgi:signal transduction histidine kinase
MLAAAEPDLQRRDSLHVCLDQALYLHRLAERVFELGRIDSPRTTLALRAVPLRALVEAALDDLPDRHPGGPPSPTPARPPTDAAELSPFAIPAPGGLLDGVNTEAPTMIHAGRGRLQIDIPRELEVQADSARLRRVFEDLLDNAFRFSPPDALVAVKAECRDGCAWISVLDEGQGMPPDKLAFVFDAFYTGDTARHHRHAHGLGLALCRRIIERHGGRIWVESDGVGHGTRVCFTLPLAQPEAGGSPAPLIGALAV